MTQLGNEPKFLVFMALLLVLTESCEASSKQGRQKAGPFDDAIETLAQGLASKYVFPTVGAQYAAMLRENLSKGEYDGIDAADEMSTRLTADLQAVSADHHLEVTPVAIGDGGSVDGAGPPGNLPPPIAAAKWVADRVAYIDFNYFAGDMQTVEAVDRFMREHATARAVIIDVRNHKGGAIREIDAILTYLFSEETPLLYMDIAESVVDEQEDPPEEGPTLRVIQGPTGIYRREHVVVPSSLEQRLFASQVFVLTSRLTVSAGEHLTLALKRTGRATVVGEPTAGFNHFGKTEKLGSGLLVFLPVGRTVDPVTEKDWEGVGIEPQVAVSADNALSESLKLVH